MRIIIVGCGKVGATIVEQLSDEGHDIVVVDINSKKIDAITTAYDVMGIVGNGTNFKVLKDAGIEDTDLLIAVTDSDEQNLLTCLIAKKAGNCSTIARVRDPELNEDIDFIAEELGLSMTVNPEKAAAVEIARLLRFPAAVQIDTFARDEVELLKFIIPANSPLAGHSLIDVGSIQDNVLICCVERGDEVIIPNGSFILEAGDKISIASSSAGARDFFRRIGIDVKHVKNVLIVGGGKIGVYLCQVLSEKGIALKIIEQDYKRCCELCEQLPEVTVIHGDGTDELVLREEGIADADAFVSLTGIDEENIFLSMFARKVSHAKVVTKIDRISFTDVINQLHLGSMIYPKKITADHIIRYVRAMSNAQGNSQIETLHELIEGKVEACSFNIGTESSIIDIPLQKLKIIRDALIVCIRRENEVIIPNGQSVIRPGDTIVVVTSKLGINDISDILEKEGRTA